MRSWPASEVPSLSDAGLPAATRPLSLHDTGTGTARPTSPDGTARMYVCGITPYDATHLGHANTYLSFDLVNRVWQDLGLRVHYVQNATDVDDPLLERARDTGEDWRALADREIQLFRDDMTALRVLPPDQYIGAVEAIPLIIEMIEKLRGRDAAYEVGGDVYFPIASDPAFGQVSRLSREEMAPLFADRGGDPDRPGKRDPLDALLWMAKRPGEPGWESPFGEGRPGWHVECSAISIEYLGMAFDVEGGGSDLAFPHHEMGASHAQVATGERPHAHAYVHACMVGLDGEKMSKSRGNLVFVSKLREAGVDPMAIRMALLAHHYRSDWEWTPAALDEANARLGRWRAAAARPSGPPAAPLAAAVRDRLAGDLDAPGALAAFDAWAAAAGTDEAAPAQARAIADALLGVAL
ncbi:cysteine--1-D-myo-inosityl 2-amino-2-deoxy-alpha-D-glucopyranoside ligase [Actinomadura darangshiensis]|uniref:L-cysteine:1D-myo-inositol 2-amino-2-deoxy-alpha-D-glucopyranoside ligase n=1 Tax=Actinomadura darangshiensis TaxID=705336 RepID=A0A4V2YQD1_9ACTN|nr:cysteine--1-D-myo-inosityl 2-amino-2-deoxy-alpha-D-glucopyranoside ligase [Actinomadura darangshiensis]TDD61637.1 cysteine--1-D-myo-inosityl 2-amino-2-deoxy-alpha-D-glucopyranoside ligase [Actinomadura darangshiensis]